MGLITQPGKISPSKVNNKTWVRKKSLKISQALLRLWVLTYRISINIALICMRVKCSGNRSGQSVLGSLKGSSASRNDKKWLYPQFLINRPPLLEPSAQTLLTGTSQLKQGRREESSREGRQSFTHEWMESSFRSTLSLCFPYSRRMPQITKTPNLLKTYARTLL